MNFTMKIFSGILLDYLKTGIFLDYQAINMVLIRAHLIVEIIPTIKKDDLILTAHKMKLPVNDFLEYVGKSAEHYRFVHTY